MTEPGPVARLAAVGFPLVLVAAAWAGAHVLQSATGTEVVHASGAIPGATQSYQATRPTPTPSVSRRAAAASSVVPDLIGYPATQARAVLASLGLRVGTVVHRSSTVQPSGVVLASVPSAGATLHGGGSVDLVVSSGTASSSPTTSVTVPDLVGLVLTRAEARLAAAGIPPSALTVVRSAGSVDVVDKQAPGPGSRIDPTVDKVVLQVGDGS